MLHKVIYVHSDNGKHKAIYIDGKLIAFENINRNVSQSSIDITKVLAALEIDYFDYQISNDVATDRENKKVWQPYQKAKDLHDVDRLYRMDEQKILNKKKDTPYYGI